MNIQGTAKKLLDAAEIALIEGNGHMEMTNVAKCANASVGLAYHHFASKSGVIAAVVDRFYDPIKDIMMGDAINVDQPWHEREKARTYAFVDYFYNHPLSPLICGRLSRTVEVLDIEQSHYESWLQEGAKNIAQGQRQGDIDMSLQPNTTITMLLGGLRLSVGQAVLSASRPDQTELFEQLWRLTCNLLQLPVSKSGISEENQDV